MSSPAGAVLLFDERTIVTNAMVPNLATGEVVSVVFIYVFSSDFSGATCPIVYISLRRHLTTGRPWA